MESSSSTARPDDPAALRRRGLPSRILVVGWRAAPRLWPWAVLIDLLSLPWLLSGGASWSEPTSWLGVATELITSLAHALLLAATLPSLAAWLVDGRTIARPSSRDLKRGWALTRDRALTLLGVYLVLGLAVVACIGLAWLMAWASGAHIDIPWPWSAFVGGIVLEPWWVALLAVLHDEFRRLEAHTRHDRFETGSAIG